MRCPLYVTPRCRHSVGNTYGDLTPNTPGGTRGEHNFAFYKKKLFKQSAYELYAGV